MGKLSNALKPALGGAEGSATFGLSLVITFTLTGFLGGYLWTRFFLGAAFQRAEREVLDEVDRVREEMVEVRKDVGVVEQQAGLSLEVVQQIEQPRSISTVPAEPAEALRQYAREYGAVRATQPPGDARTFQMSRIVADVRSLVQQQQNPIPSDSIRTLFHEGEGGRVIALACISAGRQPELLDLVLDGIVDSKSAFEQYQALRARVPDGAFERLATPRPALHPDADGRGRGPRGGGGSHWRY